MEQATGRLIRRRAIPLVLCAFALAAPACSDPTSPSLSLHLNRQKWTQHAPAAYRFQLTNGCFCPPEVIGPVTLEVVNGVVQRRYYSDSGEDVPPNLAHVFPDIGGIFDRLDDLDRRGPHRLEVSFDPTLGFPTDVSADPVKDAIDDEFGMELRAFEAMFFALDARDHRDPAR